MQKHKLFQCQNDSVAKQRWCQHLPKAVSPWCVLWRIGEGMVSWFLVQWGWFIAFQTFLWTLASSVTSWLETGFELGLTGLTKLGLHLLLWWLRWAEELGGISVLVVQESTGFLCLPEVTPTAGLPRDHQGSWPSFISSPVGRAKRLR